MMLSALRLTILASVATICFATGWQTRDWKAGADLAATLEDEKKQADLLDRLADKVATRTEESISGIKVTNTTIVQEVRREVFRDPVYVNCRLPADGVRALNAARAQSAGQPADPLRPGAAAAP